MTSSIKVAFSTDDRGVEMLLVSMFSIMERHPAEGYDVHIYVIESGLSSDNKLKIGNVASSFGNLKVTYLKVEGDSFARLQLPQARIPQQAYYRYLLPDLLPQESKVLYLDIDTLCCGPLSELFDTDISDAYIGAVEAYGIANSVGPHAGLKESVGMTKDEPYFNSGVILMNLERMRRDDTVRTFFFNAGENRDRVIGSGRNTFVDQTIANLTFRNGLKLVPYKWNTLVHRAEVSGEAPMILHFAGKKYKPFMYSSASPSIVVSMDLYADTYIRCLAIANRGVTSEVNLMLKARLKAPPPLANGPEGGLRRALTYALQRYLPWIFGKGQKAKE